jgi:uncharacterized metal-binding protein
VEERRPECVKCKIREKACRTPAGQAPPFCPMILQETAIRDAIGKYESPATREFARQASIQEGECYAGRGATPYVSHPVKTRVQETCEFARRMGYRRLGVAFCVGLQAEACTLAEILEAQGFEVVSVVCKVGATPKEMLGLKDEEKIRPGQFESMCSPIAQAEVLNRERTELNILVGLCVGHDSLFLKHASAPCTVLVTKDRVLGHAPALALHTAGSYYPWLKEPF